MARMGETPRFGSGRPDRRRQPARLRCRWEDNIKVNLQEIKWRGGAGLVWLRIRIGCGLL